MSILIILRAVEIVMICLLILLLLMLNYMLSQS